MKNPRLIFFGTPDFAVPALEALVKDGYEIVAVVTQPDKPVGRGLKTEAPPVKVKALELGLKVLQPSTLKLSIGAIQCLALSDLKADVGVCVAYGKIIPKAVLDVFPKGVLNIHPSLLPKYRGPSPIQTAILNGDAEIGLTIMLLDEEMDHGPILAQRVVIIAPSPSPLPRGEGVRRTGEGCTGSELAQRLAHTGTELLIETLPKWLAGEITPQPQEHDEATFTKMLTREDGRMNWSRPAEYLERQVRAYDLWPGTFAMWGGKRIKILHAALLHPTIGCASNSAPGYVWKTEDGSVAVNCNPGAIILKELRLEGKKSITGTAFIRGYPKFLHSALL